MKPQEANKLIAEFMEVHEIMHDGYSEYDFDDNTLDVVAEDELQYHTSWDWLMPVIDKLKFIDSDWIHEEFHIIDDIDNALTCCSGFDEVYRYTVEAIMNYNEYKS